MQLSQLCFGHILTVNLKLNYAEQLYPSLAMYSLASPSAMLKVATLTEISEC